MEIYRNHQIEPTIYRKFDMKWVFLGFTGVYKVINYEETELMQKTVMSEHVY